MSNKTLFGGADETSAGVRRGRRAGHAKSDDLDYRALSNAVLWCIGRLLTDADRARGIEGLCAAETGSDGPSAAELTDIAKRLAQRWFLMRNVHSEALC